MDTSSHSFRLGFQRDGYSSRILPRLKGECWFNTHDCRNDQGRPWSWTPRSWPCHGSAFMGSKQPQSKAAAFLPRSLMLATGRQTRALWFGADMNEPHMSMNKEGALQTRCSFSHTKARPAALLRAVFTVGYLMHCECSIKLLVVRLWEQKAS